MQLCVVTRRPLLSLFLVFQMPLNLVFIYNRNSQHICCMYFSVHFLCYAVFHASNNKIAAFQKRKPRSHSSCPLFRLFIVHALRHI